MFAAGAPAPNMQLLYEAVLCIWQLTFLQEAAETIASSAVVPSLVEVAKIAQKEKVSSMTECCDEKLLHVAVYTLIWCHGESVIGSACIESQSPPRKYVISFVFITNLVPVAVFLWMLQGAGEPPRPPPPLPFLDGGFAVRLTRLMEVSPGGEPVFGRCAGGEGGPERSEQPATNAWAGGRTYHGGSGPAKGGRTAQAAGISPLPRAARLLT